MSIVSRIALFFALLPGILYAGGPFTVSLPAGFSGPEITAKGPMQLFAYSRASAAPSVKALFQVTVVTIPPEGRGDSLEKMLGSMLRGVERRRSEFKKSAYSKGSLGSVESLSVDWEGVGEGRQMQGRMICAVSDGRLYCVHFQDTASAWPQSLPEIEKALKTWVFSK
ncbi:MAG TPA: hypothetical protein VIM71_09050 [Lacunisphaera sp.]